MVSILSFALVVLLSIQARAEDTLEDYKAQCGKEQELEKGVTVTIKSFRFGNGSKYGSDSACDWAFTGAKSCPVIQIQCPIMDLRPQKGWDRVEITNRQGKFLWACGKNVFYVPYKSPRDLQFKFVQDNPDYKFRGKYKGFKCFVACGNDANAKWLPNGFNPNAPTPDVQNRFDKQKHLTEPILWPMTGPSSAPMTWLPTAPFTEPMTDPMSNSMSDPMSNSMSDPMTNTMTDPMTEPIIEPSTQSPAIHCNCGSPDPENPNDKFPWVVAIVEEGTRVPWCSGTIINSKFILTSVSCMTCHANRANKEVMFEVIVGAQRMQKWSYEPKAKQQMFEDPDGAYRYAKDKMDINEVDAAEGSTRHKINRKISSPAFGTAKIYKFDAMLLEISPPLDNDELTRRGSVCLPEPETELRKLARSGYTVGWGSALNYGKFENKTVTEHQLPQTGDTKQHCQHMIQCVPEPTLCVIKYEYKYSADHGGPFLSEKGYPPTYQQLGLLSENYGDTMYFTNVIDIVAWIKKNADVEGARACTSPSAH